jgi:hypothetical protein
MIGEPRFHPWCHAELARAFNRCSPAKVAVWCSLENAKGTNVGPLPSLRRIQLAGADGQEWGARARSPSVSRRRSDPQRQRLFPNHVLGTMSAAAVAEPEEPPSSVKVTENVRRDAATVVVSTVSVDCTLVVACAATFCVGLNVASATKPFESAKC